MGDPPDQHPAPYQPAVPIPPRFNRPQSAKTPAINKPKHCSSHACLRATTHRQAKNLPPSARVRPDVRGRVRAGAKGAEERPIFNAPGRGSAEIRFGWFLSDSSSDSMKSGAALRSLRAWRGEFWGKRILGICFGVLLCLASVPAWAADGSAEADFQRAQQKYDEIARQRSQAAEDYDAATRRFMDARKADDRAAEAEKHVQEADERLQNSDKTLRNAKQERSRLGLDDEGKKQLKDEQIKSAEKAAKDAKKALDDAKQELEQAKAEAAKDDSWKAVNDLAKANKRKRELAKEEEAAKKALEKARAEAEKGRAGKTGDASSGTPTAVTPAGLTLSLAEALNDGRNALDEAQTALKNCDQKLFDDAKSKLISALQKLAQIAGIGLLGPQSASLQGVGAAAHSAINEIAQRWKILEALWEKNCGGTAMCAPPTGATVAGGPPVSDAPPGAPPPPGGTTGQDQSRPGGGGAPESPGGPADGETPEKLVRDDTIKDLVNNAANRTDPEASRNANQDLADFMAHAFQEGDAEALRSLASAMDSTTPSGDQNQWSAIKRAIIDMITLLDSADPAAAARAYAQRQATRQQAQSLPSSYAGAHLISLTREALVLLPGAYQTRLLTTHYNLCRVSTHKGEPGHAGTGQVSSQEQFLATVESIQSQIEAITQEIIAEERMVAARLAPSSRLDSLRQTQDALIKQRNELFKHVGGVQTDEKDRAQFIKDLCDAAKRIKNLEEYLQQAQDDFRFGAYESGTYPGNPLDEGRLEDRHSKAGHLRPNVNYDYLFEEVWRRYRSLNAARSRENPILQSQVNVGNGSGPQTLEEVLKKYCGGTNQALIDDAIDQALRQVKESIADHYVSIRQRTTMDQIIQTFGDPVLRPFLQDWAKSLKEKGIYDPALVDAMVQGVVGAYEHGKAQGEFRDRAVDFGIFLAQGALAIAMVIAPPSAVVLGPASILIGGTSISIETSRSADLGRQVTLGEEAAKIGTGDPDALRHRQQEKDAQDLTYALTLVFESIGVVGNAADIVRGIKWKGPYIEGITRGATATGQAGSEAARVGAETPGPSGAPAIAGGGPRAPPPFAELPTEKARVTQRVTGGGCAPLPTEGAAGVAGKLAGVTGEDAPPARITIGGGPTLELTDQLGGPGGFGGCYRGNVVGQPPPGWPNEVAVKVFHKAAPSWSLPDELRGHKLATEAGHSPPRIIKVVKGDDGRIYMVSELVGGDSIGAAYSRGRLLDGSPLPADFRPPRDVTYIVKGRRFNPAEQAADIEALEDFVAKGIIAWDWKSPNVGFIVDAKTGKRTAFPVDRGLFERAPPTPLVADVIPEDSTQTLLQMWSVAMGGQTPWTNPLNSLDKLPDGVRLGLTTDAGVQAIIAQEGLGRIKFNTTTRRFESGSFDISHYRGKDNLGNALRRLEELNDQYAGQAVAASGAAKAAAGAADARAGAAVAGNQQAPQAGAGSGAAGVAGGVADARAGAAAAGSGDNLAGGVRGVAKVGEAGTRGGSEAMASRLARLAGYVLRVTSGALGPFGYITAHAPLCFSYVGNPVEIPGNAGGGHLVPVGTNDPGSFGDALSKGKEFGYLEKTKTVDAQLKRKSVGEPLDDAAELVAR